MLDYCRILGIFPKESVYGFRLFPIVHRVYRKGGQGGKKISYAVCIVLYPSIAILRRYAPYRRVGSCAIFLSMSRFSSSVT